MIEFEAWPKTPRLNKVGSMTITEKIDGTNGCVVIDPEPLLADHEPGTEFGQFATVVIDGRSHLAGAQSRNRLITPSSDNAGFAAWVWEHAQLLADTLGSGRHFGEWWGLGIQRRYGMDRKIFSLFNTHRWESEIPRFRALGIGLDVVPVLYRGRFDSPIVGDWLTVLRETGSYAPFPYGIQFDRPEGVIVYRHELRGNLKAFVENDDIPKSAT